MSARLKPSKSKLRTKTARQKRSSIVIKRTYEKASKDDGVRILVDRLWPRGLSKASFKYDLWSKNLTPSNELRKWYGHDPKRFAEFRRRYGEELAPHRDEITALRVQLKGRTTTLLTSTREVDSSHATVLRDLLTGSRRR
jgi:uncharacterized protein YeaO (DUF488 family)